MTRQATDLEDELEDEFEDEFEDESEDEFEDEGVHEFEAEDEWEQEDEAFLGGLANAIGGLLGEGEDEDEAEDEAEDEDFLGALGPIARAVGGLLGGGDGEQELEGEMEDEAEEFGRGFRRFLRRAAPILRALAKTAGPLVATAVGGPAAGMIARAVTSQLEGEFEAELEGEFEDMATAPMTGAQALGEYLAAQAASTESESEAEAMAGVATYMAMSARDRRDLERMLPALLRGTAVLTRLLHGNRHTRPAVRLVPGIVDGAARAVLRRSAAGLPVDAVQVGRALGAAATRVLGPGPARGYVARRHARGIAHARRRSFTRRPGGYRSATGPAYRGGRRPMGLDRTIRRQPTSTTTIVGQRRVSRPRPGFVRVVTPVRVPPRNGRPGGTVRVVSDVRVPRGAVPAGRPTSVSSRHGRSR